MFRYTHNASTICIGIDGDVSFAPDNLLSGVESALLRRGRLNRLDTSKNSWRLTA